MLREDLKFITIDYLRETNQLSVRSANCCLYEGLDNLYKIITFFEENGSFTKNKIKNAGYKTSIELDELCLKILPKIEKEKQHVYVEIREVKSIIKELSEPEREVLISIANLIDKFELEIKERAHIISYNNNDIFNFAVNYCIGNGNFPMFGILGMFLNLDNDRDIRMSIEILPVFQDCISNKLNEVAEKYNLSRERVRQICNVDFCNIFDITSDVVEHKKGGRFFKYYELLQSRSNWDYVLDILSGIDIVTHETHVFRRNLQKEQNNLSFEFAAQIIAYIFRDVFIIYGSRFNCNKKAQEWKYTFLIRKIYTDYFDFEKMRDEFENILCDNDIEFFLDIEKYISISQCWINFDYNKINRIVDITKTILLHEFGLYSDEINGQIKIPAVRERKTIDVVYDILKQNGKPMHLKDIFLEFKKLLPEHKYTIDNNPERLRPSLYKHNGITTVNRKSLYSLKEWNHTPRGTIRNKIVEFLEYKDTPQTVECITDYVNLYFKTNEKNVYSSMCSGKYFIQFNGNLFGLKNKHYSSDFKKIEKRGNEKKSFEQRLRDIEIFIVKNKHFPFSVSENNYEISLYRWWVKIEKRRKKLTPEQQMGVDRIKRVYADFNISKEEFDWQLKYDKLKTFLIVNRRKPTANGTENDLYRWFHRIKRDFIDDKLSEDQRRKYIELVKLI